MHIHLFLRINKNIADKKQPKKVYPDLVPDPMSILWAATNMTIKEFDKYLYKIKRHKAPKRIR